LADSGAKGKRKLRLKTKALVWENYGKKLEGAGRFGKRVSRRRV